MTGRISNETLSMRTCLPLCPPSSQEGGDEIRFLQDWHKNGNPQSRRGTSSKDELRGKENTKREGNIQNCHDRESSVRNRGRESSIQNRHGQMSNIRNRHGKSSIRDPHGEGSVQDRGRKSCGESSVHDRGRKRDIRNRHGRTSSIQNREVAKSSKAAAAALREVKLDRAT